MKNILLSILFVFIYIGATKAQIVVDNGEDICDKLKSALASPGFICFVKSDPNISEFYDLYLDNCDELPSIGTGTELRIPGLTILHLSDTELILEGDGKLTGENYFTSRIVIEDCEEEGGEIEGQGSCSAVVLNNCMGCEVSDLTFTSATEEGELGVQIDEDSEDNTFNSVKFEELKNGLLVEGDNNNFYDLQFFNVATDFDCTADDNDEYGIKLVSSNSNEFINILHTRSPGATTVLFDGVCNNNTLISVSVEQEQESNLPMCTEKAIYINSTDCTGNVITTNYNDASTYIKSGSTNDENIICGQNSISDLDNCQAVSLPNCPE